MTSTNALQSLNASVTSGAAALDPQLAGEPAQQPLDAWPAKSGVLNASATLQLGSESVIGFGKRTPQTNWNYVGVSAQGLAAIARSIESGQPVDKPIRISYYYEADPSRFGDVVQKKLEKLGISDVCARANLTLRPATPEEAALGKGWQVQSADLSLAVEPSNSGVFPATHPTKNGNAWFAGVTYDEKTGFATQAIGATALVSRLPGHAKHIDSRVGPFNVAGIAYGFNVPLPPGRQVGGSAAAVTNAVSALTGQVLPEHAKPLGDVLGLGARANEARHIANAFDAALVRPRQDAAGAALVARGRYLLQHERWGGLQLEGNGVLLLQSDGNQDVKVLDPAGNELVSVPYDKLMQALEPFRQKAQAFTRQSQVVESLAQGLALRTSTATAVGWARHLAHVFKPGAPANQALGAVRDVIRAGDGSWDDVAHAVGGWKRLAEGVGGWSNLVKEVGGWGQLAKHAGGWMPLAREVGGARALAAAMGGWNALRAVAGQTVYFAAIAEVTRHVGRSNSVLANKDLTDPTQAQQVLRDIEQQQESPLSRFLLPPASSVTEDHVPRNQREGLEVIKEGIEWMHPQLAENYEPKDVPRTRAEFYNAELNRLLTVYANDPSRTSREALNNVLYEATYNKPHASPDPWLLQAAREALDRSNANEPSSTQALTAARREALSLDMERLITIVEARPGDLQSRRALNDALYVAQTYLAGFDPELLWAARSALHAAR
jgi:hypothetical protein